ncbi:MULTISPECIES: HAD family phosphatase [unclassified Arthrobacter]|uniref:HAD family hydrolase n=1 Tax=unclassified Arthrobacter TaxID=235627 RepID=UPI001E349994|nr:MULTISPECIES: HAD family phosphatase [unclassified Arthrobacter]MCC9145426.1 HAD family phosphatase [Arthrobacter sp. zg-Y919]MDK1276654.1 HAD family phosphatase [Arthrobacter sp. zg.Y919]WIB04397.1 HAD family phosphatase [Arthrobacter sp. zg-Y919]
MPPVPADDSLPSPAGTALQAVFWDMDGTIVDTEPYWIAAEKELTSEFGVDWTDAQAEAMVGQALETSAGMLQRAGVPLGSREIIDRLIGQVAEQVRRQVPWRPGARELLEDLRAAGIPCALVTMSEPVLAGEIVRALPAGTFDVVVTGDMVSSGKPDPEPYQLAFDTLAAAVPGLDKASVVAIEDSLPGATSAQSAGLVTLAVPNFIPLPPGMFRHVWDSLAGRGVGQLSRLLPGSVLEAAR